jgi:predicted dehydrogenase
MQRPHSRSFQDRRQFLTTLGLGWAGIRQFGAAAEADAPLRAAVIGHTGRGDYGHGLDTIFSQRKGIQVVALADPDEGGRIRTAAKIGAPRSYADPLEMIEKEKPQLVSVAMRQSDQHRQLMMAALRAGAHVYCEKPFVTTLAEADELLREAEHRKLRIAVAHTMRMAPAIRALRQMVADGAIGELAEMRAYGKQDARAGGEDMMVLGSHLFDLLRLIAGDPEWCSARVLWQGREISAKDRRMVADNVGWVAGDEVFAQFAFPHGVNATFTSTAKMRPTVGHWGIELFGSKGAARINCDVAPNVFVRQSAEWSSSGHADTWQPIDPKLIRNAAEHNSGPVDDWLDAIAKNREPECSGRNGAWAVEMVMAVYRSALTGQRAVFPLKERSHPLEG